MIKTVYALVILLLEMPVFPAHSGSDVVQPVETRLEAIFPDVVENYDAFDAEGVELIVPYVPTPMAVVDAILEMARVGPDDILFDLGCGDGRIVIAAAVRFGARGVGVDLDPRRIEESKRNAAKAGVEELVSFRLADIFDADFSRATVVALYLLPEVNLKLRPRFFNLLRPGSRVVSHEFDMGDWEPDSKLLVMASEEMDHRLFLWFIPARVEGSWLGSIQAGSDSLPFRLELERDFQTVSGKIEFDSVPTPLAEGRLWGTGISLETDAVLEGVRVRLRLLGEVDGNEANGLALIGKGRWSGVHPWRASRLR